jgi:transglutaminase-like putative cysteine protease
MTSGAATIQGRSLGDAIEALPRRPMEGWLSLFTVAVMLFAVGFSLQDAGWTADAAGYSGLLSWLGLVGLAFGFAGAKVGWGRWRTHFVGALFAGVFLPLLVGGIALGDGVGWDPQSLAARMTATLEVLRRVWFDLVVVGQSFTSETTHYPLVFGGLMWGAGMLAGFTVFGHRRPLDAVVVLGLILLANMALTHDQLWILVTFSSAGLLLLIRTHVFEEEVTWVRRRIGDPAAVSQVYLIAGAQFVIVAVLGSILLTATASSAPLQGLWQDLPQHLQSISQWFQRFAPPGLDVKPGLGVITFGDDAETSGFWQPSNRVAFRAQLSAGEERRFKWRAGTYAVYTTQGWDWGTTERTGADPGVVVVDQDPSGDLPTGSGRTEVAIRVIPDAFRDSTVVSPNTLVSVDVPTNVLGVGPSEWFTTVESTAAIGPYNVTALVPVFRDSEDGITEPLLRRAGTEYPAGLVGIYTALPAGSMGAAATDLLAAIRAEVTAPSYADPDNPYDLARTMQAHLRNDANFRYQEDVRAERNAQCSGLSTVECFARIRVGYCDYYASTMAVLMRAAGVPARVVYGFLPGDRGPDGVEVVGAWTSHYWVEVYFPGVGWIEFDPTGGGIGLPQAIPSSSVGPETARPSVGPAESLPTRTVGPVAPVDPVDPSPGASIGPFIVIGIILAVGIGALAFAAYRRSPGRPMDPDQAWGSVSRLASRFGLGPRPSQTVYEYAGSLGDAVPAARIELTTIARAKVEVAYGKRDLGGDRMRSIAEAYRRLRFAILGVVLRRGFRRRRGR